MFNFWKKTFFFVLAGFLSWTFFAFAQEQKTEGERQASFYEKSAVYIVDLKINSQTREKIEGAFTVHNSEDYEIYNLNHRVQLLKDEDQNSELIDVQYEDDSQAFYVLRKSDATRSFTYKIPQNINPGNYKLRLQVGSANPKDKGISLNEYSRKDVKVALSGLNNLLLIDESSLKFLPAKNKFNSYNPNEEIKIGFDVLNPTANSIAAVPRTIIDKYVTKKVRDSETFNDSITFEPKKSKYVELVLPKISQPQIYQLYLQFVSDQSDKSEIYSSIIETNFSIAGPFAEIMFIYHDKESYKKGDVATIKVTYLSSSFPKELGTKFADLLLSVQNQETGKNCSAVVKTSLPFKGGLGQATTEVRITGNCLKPIVFQDLLIDEQSVDSNILQTPSMLGLSQKLSEEINRQIKKNLTITVEVLIGIGIIIFALYLKRKKKKTLDKQYAV